MRSQPVTDPGANTGHRYGSQTAVHGECCLAMTDMIGDHGADDRHVVDGASQQGKQLTDHQACIAFWRKTKRRSVQIKRSAPPVHYFSVVCLQSRFIVKRVDVRQTTSQVNQNQVFCAGRKM